MFMFGSPAALHPVGLGCLGAAMLADRQSVLTAYANNPGAQLYPDQASIAYWMQVGLDNFDATVLAVRQADASLAAQIDAERLAAVVEIFGDASSDPGELIHQKQVSANIKLQQRENAPSAPVVTPAVKDYVLIESEPDQLVPIAVGPVIAPPIAPPPVSNQPVVPDVPTLIELTPEQECAIYCEWSAAKSRALVGGEYVTMEAFPRPQNCTCPDEIIKTPVVTDNVVIKDSRTVPAETTTTPAPAMPTGAIFAAIAAYLLLG